MAELELRFGLSEEESVRHELEEEHTDEVRISGAEERGSGCGTGEVFIFSAAVLAEPAIAEADLTGVVEEVEVEAAAAALLIAVSIKLPLLAFFLRKLLFGEQ